MRGCNHNTRQKKEEKYEDDVINLAGYVGHLITSELLLSYLRNTQAKRETTKRRNLPEGVSCKGTPALSSGIISQLER